MKILIIRFSSIGDVIQCMSVTCGLYAKYDKPEIHWITRTDMSSILKTDPHIKRVWDFDREEGYLGLINMAQALRKEKFDIIYDAHLNIRSFTVRAVIAPLHRLINFKKPRVLVRYKYRIRRFLFFSLNYRKALPMPFRGMVSFQKPLKELDIDFKVKSPKDWLFPNTIITSVQALLKKENVEITSKTITLIPSAAWELKRWPIDHWKGLVDIMPDYNFIILGGPEDTFTQEIKAIAPERILNLSGKTNLNQSFYLVWISNFVVSADTGFLHAADLFNKNGIALMGPTAFGHTTGDSISVMEIDLRCRPCSKEGNSVCKLVEIKKCLVDIRPQNVKQEIERRLKA